jgi:hypothetical protein
MRIDRAGLRYVHIGDLLYILRPTVLVGKVCLASQMKAMVIVSPKRRRIRDTPREDCAFINTWTWHATVARWQRVWLVQLEASLLCLRKLKTRQLLMADLTQQNQKMALQVTLATP